MGRLMKPSRVTGNVERVGEYPCLAGQSIVEGSVVYLDANGLLNLAGADPTTILGVALNAISSKPGFNAANSPLKINSPDDAVSVAIAYPGTIFSARGDSGGALQTPTQAQVGDLFGIVNQSGEWCVDISDTTNTRVRVVDVDIDNKIYFFKFESVGTSGAAFFTFQG